MCFWSTPSAAVLVAITNAVYDTLHGDYISGAARMLEAFVTAAAIGIGVGLSMALFQVI